LESLTQAPLTRERALELFGKIDALHRSKDPSLITTVYTEDVLIEDDGGTQTVRGAAEAEAFLASVWRAFPDFGVEIIEGPYLSEGGFAVHGRIRGTMEGPLDPPGLAPTGTRMSAEFGGFYEPEGDRIRRVRVIMNATEIATQLGALPEPGSPGERIGVLVQRVTAWRMRRRAR
jgi:predicted ester cyclase